MSQQITTPGRIHNVNEVATTRPRDRSIDLARGLALVFSEYRKMKVWVTVDERHSNAPVVRVLCSNLDDGGGESSLLRNAV